MRRKQTLFSVLFIIVLTLTFILPNKALAESYQQSTSYPEKYLSELKQGIIDHLEMNYTRYVSEPDILNADYRVGSSIPIYRYDGEHFYPNNTAIEYPVYSGTRLFALDIFYPSGERMANFPSMVIAEPLNEYINRQQNENLEYFLVFYLQNCYAISEGKVHFISSLGGMVLNDEAIYKDEIDKIKDPQYRERFLDWYKEYKELDGVTDIENEKKLQDLTVEFLEDKLKESDFNFQVNADKANFSSLPVVFKASSVQLKQSGIKLKRPSHTKEKLNQAAPPTGDPFFAQLFPAFFPYRDKRF